MMAKTMRMLRSLICGSCSAHESSRRASDCVREIQEPQWDTIQPISNTYFAPEFIEAVVGSLQFSDRDDEFRAGRQSDRWADAAPSLVNRLGAWEVSH